MADTWRRLVTGLMVNQETAYQPIPTEEEIVIEAKTTSSPTKKEISSPTKKATSSPTKKAISSPTKKATEVAATTRATPTTTSSLTPKEEINLLRRMARIIQDSYQVGDYVLPATNTDGTTEPMITKETLCYVVRVEREKRDLWRQKTTAILVCVKDDLIRVLGVEDRLFRKASDEEIAKFSTPSLMDFAADTPISDDANPGLLLRPRKNCLRSPYIEGKSVFCLCSFPPSVRENMANTEVIFLKDGRMASKLVPSFLLSEYTETPSDQE